MVKAELEFMACKKKQMLINMPRTVSMHMEAMTANRFNRVGGAEYSVPSIADPIRARRSAGVAVAQKQKERPKIKEVIIM